VRRAALMTVIAAAGLLAACTNTQPGQPSPSIGQTPSSSGTAASGLAALKACGLITDAEAKQAVPNVGSPQDQGQLGGSASACQWSEPAANGSHALNFAIAVRPRQGLDDMVLKPGWQSSNATTTGGRRAKRPAIRPTLRALW
jgi:hypothetical protein